MNLIEHESQNNGEGKTDNESFYPKNNRILEGTKPIRTGILRKELDKLIKPNPFASPNTLPRTIFLKSHKYAVHGYITEENKRGKTREEHKIEDPITVDAFL
jgi:hypothetical protein